MLEAMSRPVRERERRRSYTVPYTSKPHTHKIHYLLYCCYLQSTLFRAPQGKGDPSGARCVGGGVLVEACEQVVVPELVVHVIGEAWRYAVPKLWVREGEGERVTISTQRRSSLSLIVSRAAHNLGRPRR
jgi:hypothetical protein